MSPVDALRRRLRRRPPTFEPGWDAILREGFEHWRLLDETELERMRLLVARFVHRTRWEAARGMELTDEIRVLIAGQAALLLLGLEIDDYPDLSSVIVHRSTARLPGARPTGRGVWSDAPQYLSGQAGHRGSVMLSWAAARRGAARPERGQNVVYHEFAHRLDMLDGITDGTPPLGDPDRVARWRDVCTAAFERVRDGESVLRSYAGTNPAEFFAVATEVFFNRPHELRAGEPDLYAELESFYGQDPARRVRATLGDDLSSPMSQDQTPS